MTGQADITRSEAQAQVLTVEALLNAAIALIADKMRSSDLMTVIAMAHKRARDLQEELDIYDATDDWPHFPSSSAEAQEGK